MRGLYQRLKSFIVLIKHYDRYIIAPSYYMEYEHKSSVRIFLEQLYFILRYGDFEPYYFTYGFDRKNMSIREICFSYIVPYYLFQKKVNRLNTINPVYGIFHGRSITADKFYFSIFLNSFGIPTPKVLCFVKGRNIIYMDSKFVNIEGVTDREKLKIFFSMDMDAFAKPSDGQLGNGVFSLQVKNKQIYKNGHIVTLDELLEVILSADYLIQERVYQHPAMAALCSSTLNSIRLQTVMTKEGKVIPFGAGLRIGREGSSVDNWAKGGTFVGIDMQKGRLLENGFLKPQYGTITKRHLDSGVVFKDYEIPFFREAVDLALELHTKMYRFHSVGWDIAITEKGPVFIEGNGLWEISLLQAVHGGLKSFEKYFIV